jgi:signal transduction histidine kinase
MSAQRWRPARSIRTRVAAVCIAVAFGTAAALAAVVYGAARAESIAALDAHLHRDLELTLTALTFGPDGVQLRPFQHASDDPHDPDPMFELWVLGERPRRAIAHPASVAFGLTSPAPIDAQPVTYRTEVAGSVRWRVHEARFTRAGTGYLLRVLRDKAALDRQLARVWVQLLALALVTGAVGAAVAYWAVRRALAPLQSMAQSLSELGPERLDTRLAVPETADEVAQLAHAHNATLGRIAAAYRDHEAFAARVAHELRTPLSSLRAAADVALAGGSDPHGLRDALRRTLEECDRLSQLVNRLLLLGRPARADGGAARMAVDLLCAEVVELLRPLCEERGQQITWLAVGGPHVAVGDRVLLTQLLFDLVDNAIRHSGDGTRILLSVAAATDGEVSIDVTDDGCGMPTAGTAPRGTGLGITIAQRLAAQLGGHVAWLANTPRGTRAVVTLRALQRG